MPACLFPGLHGTGVITMTILSRLRLHVDAGPPDAGKSLRLEKGARTPLKCSEINRRPAVC
jgi:hypothetical protein